MAQSRGILAAGFDRPVSWLLGLPSERCSYSTETVTIPLKDGTTLKADIYKPIGIQPLSTILVQCPYGRGIFMSSNNGHTFAPRGYQVLLVSSRGTFGSTGEFDGNKSQREDGQEVVAWMRGQSWYTGSFATLGASNMGYAQWALLRDQPKDMVAAIITVGPHDFAKGTWGSGAELILKQETAGFMERMKIMKNERLAPLMNTVPLQDQVDAFFGDEAPWLNQALNHPDIEDPSWSRLRHTEALEKADIPILLISALYERGCNVALTICPGGHMEITNGEITGDTFAWLEKYLAGEQDIDRKSPVKLYLGSDGDLGNSIPSKKTSSSFTFDPEAPTPTLGGPLMSNGGSIEDSALAARDDTLVFTTEHLKEPLTMFGQPMVQLEHSTDRPYADLFVRISEVGTKSKSYNITEGFIRLPESRTSRSVTITMRPTAYQFPAGARIRFLIAGGSHPQYARNYGSGEPLATGTTLCPVNHTVYHGAQAISSLALPVGAVSVGETAGST
ncbi:galactose-binding domain-like protein [Fusarium sp. MPI-SDFR-AT-0072]|nr:galactose-binding domain-like protein [Fusarium sp. MPI-SDFR-AT-0072]